MSLDNENSFNEDTLRESLIEKSILAKQHAYCPYSKFRVGAALLTNDNQIYTGCNVENSSYGLTICAERTAIVKAVSDGNRKFKEIAITTDLKHDYVTPCGTCRQFISEFGNDITIILVKTKIDYKVYSIKELLPMAFDINILKLHSIEVLNKNEKEFDIETY